MGVTPWSSVGYLTYRRTYARMQDNGEFEEYEDTCRRVVNAAKELPVPLSDEDEERLYNIQASLKGSVAGRFLWQLGTPTVEKLGLFSLMNCAFVTVDKPKAFTWAADALMLGSGVGYNIQRKYVYKLPQVASTFSSPIRQDDASADFIVPDTREGWVALLERTLACAFNESERQGFTYSVQLVRGAGAPIKGFGGTASGPEILCRGLAEIGQVIERRRGKQFRPIDCLDIMNLIGSIVVSGNVRRSAQIAIGDCDDLEFLGAKNWGEGNIPHWRSLSNNSVVCNDIKKLPQQFWDTYNGQSEPYGLINLNLTRKVGRTGDTRYPDKDVKGFNPCAEQSLNDYETCCLGTIFLPNIESEEELFEVASVLYKVCKGALALPCHIRETEAVVHKNFRMGLSVTGTMECTEEQLGWLEPVYERLRQFDKEYSKQHGVPESIKLTTVQPSGTLSLLPGVTPGCHPAFAEYMIRRIRIAADHPLVQACRDAGYKVEFNRNFGVTDHSTVVVEFPFRHRIGVRTADQVSAIEQLEHIRFLQTNWSDNAVSCTVYYRPEELDGVKEYLRKHYNDEFKTLSFLLYSDHGFDQAPLEAITKEQYEELVASTIPITSLKGSAEFDSDSECSNGVCPIK